VGFLAAVFILFNGAFAEQQIAQRLKAGTGLDFAAKGGMHIMLAPLAVRLDDVVIARPGAEPLVMAKSLTVPLTIRSLLSHRLAPNVARFDAPAFTFIVDGEGQANWVTAGDALDRALSRNAVPGEALRLDIGNGAISFEDRRRSNAFTAMAINGEAVLSTQGALDLSAGLLLNRQPAKFVLHADALARLVEDGTPADMTLTAEQFTASFSGRLRACEQVELAGTINVESADARDVASWAELDAPAVPRRLSINGSIESTGAAFRFPAIMVAADGAGLKGEAAFDAGAARPKLTAKLTTDRLALDPYLAGGSDKLDVDVTIAARAASWSGFSLGAMTLIAKRSSNEALLAIPDARFFNGAGFVNFRFAADGIAADLDLKQVDLSMLSREPKLKGRADIAASLTGQGQSIDALWSSLGGEATLLNGQGTMDGAGAFSGLSASFILRDGVAATKDVGLTLDGQKLKGSGQIDLLRQALDFEFAGSKSNGVTLKGPLSAVKRGD
jgi:uncharacterized protein involved in outer membrane biogenesis